MKRLKFFVLLIDDGPKQVWLGYNNLGRIGSCDFRNATRYESISEALAALRMVRRERRWASAKVIGTLEEVADADTH